MVWAVLNGREEEPYLPLTTMPVRNSTETRMMPRKLFLNRRRREDHVTPRGQSSESGHAVI